MAATLRMDSVGVEILVPLTDTNGNPIDLEPATVLTLFMQPPNSTTSSGKTATKVGSGKEGIMRYLTVAGDLHTAGDWKVQARIQYEDPVRDWFSEIYPMVVASNLGPASTGTFRVQ